MPGDSSIIRIKPTICKNQYTKNYIQIPSERSCKTTSTDQSRAKYIRHKADILHNVLKSIAPPPDVIGAILTHLALEYKYRVFNENSVKLTVPQIAVLQTLTGMTANGVERLKSGLSIICPLLSDLFPGCIRAELTAFELDGSLEVKHEQMSLVVTSSSEKKAIRVVSYLSSPIQALQTIVEAGKAVNKYIDSNELTNLDDACLITYNIDKGGGAIVASVSCRNIKDGNSSENCFCIGHVSGPVSENHANMNDAFFKNNCPVGRFTHDLNERSLCIITMSLPITQKQKQYRKSLGIDGKEKKHCRSLIFKSGDILPESITMASDFVNEDDVEYSGEGDEIPRIDFRGCNDLKCRLVKNDIGILVGARLENSDGDVLLAQKFLRPIEPVDIVDIRMKMKTKLERIHGFPANDMKMQLLLAGISSASCTYGCPNCCSPRSKFKLMPSSLCKKIIELGGDLNAFEEWGAGEYKLRWNDHCPKECKVRYDQQTCGLHMTEEIKKFVKHSSKSVTNDVLLFCQPIMNNGDPLHVQCGINNHYNKSIWDWIKQFDTSFVECVQDKLDECSEALDKQQTTKKQVKNKDNLPSNEGIKRRQQQLSGQKHINAVIKQINKFHLLKTEKMKNVDVDTQTYSKQFSPEDVKLTETQIDDRIEDLGIEYEELFRTLMSQLDTTENAHHAQCLKGTKLLVDKLTEILSPASKLPRGKLEYVYETSLRKIGGGSFCPEHGGRDQTNGKAMQSLENFSAIVDACIASCASEQDEKRAEITKKFEGFRVAGEALFQLNLKIKSQKKLDPDDFENAIATFLVALEKAFPDYNYYNKLHFLANHATEFVREFHCYGLLSSEGHESHHGKVHKKTTLLKSVRSHDLRSRRFFGGELALLNQEYARQFAQIKEKRTGKKRGTYKTTHKDATEHDHDQFVSTLSMLEFDGKQYFQIPNDGGILPEENKEIFLYVAYGIPPLEWKDNEVLARYGGAKPARVVAETDD